LLPWCGKASQRPRGSRCSKCRAVSVTV
jgi:hypothetical protein